MSVQADTDRVSYLEDGVQLFTVRWEELHRVTAWRNPHPDREGFFLSLEIVPQPTTGIAPHIVMDNSVDGIDDEWDAWLEVLTEHVKNFSAENVQSVLRLPPDENAVHFVVNERLDEEAVVVDGIEGTITRLMELFEEV